MFLVSGNELRRSGSITIVRSQRNENAITALTTLAKSVINVDNLDWGWTVIITNPSKGRFGTVWLARRGMARHDGQGKARQGEIGWQMRC